MFFGEKNKILTYYINQNDWILSTINPTKLKEFHFNYYSSATSVSNNQVLITGGGQSKDAFLI